MYLKFVIYERQSDWGVDWGLEDMPFTLATLPENKTTQTDYEISSITHSLNSTDKYTSAIYYHEFYPSSYQAEALIKGYYVSHRFSYWQSKADLLQPVTEANQSTRLHLAYALTEMGLFNNAKLPREVTRKIIFDYLTPNPGDEKTRNELLPDQQLQQIETICRQKLGK